MKFPVSDQLIRQMVRDGYECEKAPAMLAALGLAGESEDVGEMEHRASHERTVVLTKYAPELSALSHAMGAITAGMAVAEAKQAGVEVPEEIENVIVAMNARLIVSSTIAILAQMIEHNLLLLPGN